MADLFDIAADEADKPKDLFDEMAHQQAAAPDAFDHAAEVISRQPTPQEMEREDFLSYQPPVGNLLTRKPAAPTMASPSMKEAAAFDTSQPTAFATPPPVKMPPPQAELQAYAERQPISSEEFGGALVKGAVGAAVPGLNMEMTEREQRSGGQYLGGVAGGLLPLAAGPLAIPAMMASSGLQAASRGMDERGQVHNPIEVGVQAALAGLLAIVPPAVGKGILARATTGGGIGAVQGAVQEAASAMMQRGEITQADLQNPETWKSIATSTLMGAGFGAHGVAGLEAPRTPAQVEGRPGIQLNKENTQAFADALNEPPPPPPPLAPPPQQPRDRSFFGGGPDDAMQARQWAHGTEAQTALAEAKAAYEAAQAAHEPNLRASVEAENALRGRFPDPEAPLQYPAERDLLRTLKAKFAQAEEKGAETQAALEAARGAHEEATRKASQATAPDMPQLTPDQLEGRKTFIQAMRDAGTPAEQIRDIVNRADLHPKLYETRSKAVDEAGLQTHLDEVSRETSPLMQDGEKKAPHQVSFELQFGQAAPWRGQFPEFETLSYEKKSKVTKDVLSKVMKIAAHLSGVKGLEVHGPGGWGTDPVNPSGHFLIPHGTPIEKVQDFADMVGALAQQDGVFISNAHPGGKQAAIDIQHPEFFADPKNAAAYWDALKVESPEIASGFHPIEGGIRIVRPEGADQIPALQAKFDAAIDKVSTKFGLDTESNYTKVDSELRSNNWKESPDGSEYFKRLEARHGSDIQERIRRQYQPSIEADIRAALPRGKAGRALFQDQQPAAHGGSERAGLGERFGIDHEALAANTPEAAKQVYTALGNKVADHNTQAELKIYPLGDVPPEKLTEWLERDGWKYKIFGPDQETGKFVPPNFKEFSYDNKHVWIFSPWTEHGSFKDTEYTRLWRVTHEVAHGQTNNAITERYGGVGRRQGALGRPTKFNGRDVPPLSLADAIRAVDWEHETFKRQREILEKEFGVKITDEQFRKENSINLSDAVYRVLSGDFSNPGDNGMLPRALPPEQLLARAKDILRQAAKDTGLDMAETFGGKPATSKEAYPKAGTEVDGLKVRSEVPNTGSIRASMTDYKILPGVREVSFDAFPDRGPAVRGKRETELAEQIKSSGEINPLIVAIDEKGPYILEGGHRFDALQILGKKSFPAMVVEEGKAQAQRDEAGVKGAFIPSAPEKKALVLLVKGKADASTAIHELLGHGMEEKVLRAKGNEALLAEAEKLIAADLPEAITADRTWSREAKEWLARKVEQYFYEGSTDVPTLKPLFERIRSYMRDIYQSVFPGGKLLSPEQRQFFDKIFQPEGQGGKAKATPEEVAPRVRQEARRDTRATSPDSELPESTPKAPPRQAEPTKHVPGERSLPKTLEAHGLPGGDDRAYDVKPNAQTAAKAVASVDSKGLDGAANDILANRRFTAEDMATSQVVMKRWQSQAESANGAEKDALLAKTVHLASEMSRRATEAGQFIQAVQILDKLSPDGVVFYATRQLEKLNEQRPGRKPVTLAPKQAEELRTAAKALGVEGGLKDAAKAAQAVVDKAGKETLSPEDLAGLKEFRDRLLEYVGEAPVKRPKGLLRPAVKAPAKEKESLDKYLSAQESAALARLKARGLAPTKALFQSARALAEEDVADLAQVFAARLAKRGDNSVGAIRQSFIESFGPEVKPHLDRIAQAGARTLSKARGERTKLAAIAARVEEILTPLLESGHAESVETAENLQTAFEQLKTLSGEAQIEASWDLQEALRGLAPATLGQKVATAQTIAQLLNPKTIARNAASNEMFHRLERLNKYVTAAAIDWPRTVLFGGDPKVTWKTGGQGGYWKAFLTGAKAAARGVNPEGLESKYDLGATAFKDKRNPLFWLERGLGISLKAFDYAAYTRAKGQTLGELASLAADARKVSGGQREAFIKKWIEDADDAAQGIAESYGKYVTFQDDTFLANAASAFKKGLNKVTYLGAVKDPKFGLGDMILKYPKTPANLIMRGLEYSPAGIVRSIRLAAEPFLTGNPRDVRELELSLGRAITGTLGMTAFGYFLASKGVLTGQREKDRDARDFMSDQTGQRNYQVNASALSRWVRSGLKPDQLNRRDGDILVSYDWAQPMAMNLAMAATANQAMENKKHPVEGALASAEAGLEASAQSLQEQPLLKGISDLFDKNTSVSKKLMNIAEEIPASFVPTFISQLKQAKDNTARIKDAPDVATRMLNKVIYKIPFVSEMLPAAYKTIGKDVPKEMYQNGSNTLFNVFLNPAFVAKYHLDPSIAAILAPYQSEGRVKQFPYVAPKHLKYQDREGPHTMVLTGEQLSELQRSLAQNTAKAFAGIDYEALKEKSPEHQEKELGERVSKAWERSRIEFLRGQGIKFKH